jgi:hypothetical protein
MLRTLRTIALLSLAGTSALGAQGPGRTGRPAGAPAARLLLSHTGALELTDAQVTRLAVIERRAEARRKALRAAMDSARTRFQANPADSVGRRQFAQRMRADLDRTRDQARVDQRDALAVLNADQQSRAWDLMSSRGRAMRDGMRGGRGMRPMRPMKPGRMAPRRPMRGDDMGPRREMRERRPMRVPGRPGEI